ncbi:hypothetical protein FJTKL_04922 [Diaporthe vaccinii]|uniref:DNA/RNA-binding domain-containing protein n=1 Tax=Diaporthe vaccinii TaxID=105482 RepID=A0ABR4DT25_9PEZI
MGGGPADETVVSVSVPPRLDPSATLSTRLAAQAQHKGTFTSTQQSQMSLDTSTRSSQPIENDFGHDGSHETNTTADDAENGTATATSREKDAHKLPMRKQPETRPISQEQLRAEAKGIYAGLVMVEEKCKTLDVPSSLKDEQYQALMNLFRVLINEHYDFFSISQHPEASPAFRKLAKKYQMAMRMWRHGIHAWLELLRKRLPESQECTEAAIYWSYGMIGLLDETVPQFRPIWVETKGDIARYGWAILNEGDLRQRWKYVAQEEYTQALNDDPRVGRLYHHLAILMQLHAAPQSDEYFDHTVIQLFYFTKSLVVEKPFFMGLDSLSAVISPIVARNKERELSGIPLNEKDHFLTAVVNLILASLEPELLRAHGYRTCKKDHLQAVYTALAKIGRPVGVEQAQTSRIRPSAHLGLLICQLLLGIPSASGRWSPMLATWAPDLVTPADRANLPANMINAKDIHDATIAMVYIMVPYLLQEADTRDLRFWGFVYSMLVFMRSLKTRPGLREWLGAAFRAEMLAPFLNMLLREDETRGGRALESASQSGLLKLCSPLNQKESTATTEEATTSHAAHERDQDAKLPDPERMYTIPLPEDELLRGHFFAREADAPYNESSTGSNKDIVACPPIVGVTISGVKAAEGAAVDQAQEESLTDPETESEALDEEQKGSGSENARQIDEQTEEGGGNDTQHKDKQNEKAREARDTEVQRREGLLRDPPLFPASWFKNSKYDFDERQVRQDYVQDAVTYDNRSRQILCLAVQLIDVFFDFRNKNGRHWISVLGAPAFMPPSNMQMPEIIERDDGARVVFVHPFHIAEIENERVARAWEESNRQIEEEARASTDVATAVDKKVESNAEKQPTASEEQISESGPSITYEPEHTKAKVEATLSVQGPDNSLDTAASDVDADAATATASPEDQATTTAPTENPNAASQAPANGVQLSTSSLDAIPKSDKATTKRWLSSANVYDVGYASSTNVYDVDEDEDAWTHISDESRGDAAQTAQAAAGSIISRSYFWRGR